MTQSGLRRAILWWGEYNSGGFKIELMQGLRLQGREQGSR